MNFLRSAEPQLESRLVAGQNWAASRRAVTSRKRLWPDVGKSSLHEWMEMFPLVSAARRIHFQNAPATPAFFAPLRIARIRKFANGWNHSGIFRRYRNLGAWCLPLSAFSMIHGQQRFKSGGCREAEGEAKRGTFQYCIFCRPDLSSLRYLKHPASGGWPARGTG